jgi:hypothetical protein
MPLQPQHFECLFNALNVYSRRGKGGVDQKVYLLKNNKHRCVDLSNLARLRFEISRPVYRFKRKRRRKRKRKRSKTVQK